MRSVLYPISLSIVRLAVALAILAAARVALPSQAQDAPAPSAPLLRIDVAAVDRRGQSVSDLKRDEVEVWIGIYRVPVETFTAVTSVSESRGRTIVLLLDDVIIHPEMALRVREIARRFVSRLAPGDKMAVAALNGDVTESTDDPARLRRTIEAYSGYAGGYMRPDDIGAQVFTRLESLSRQLVEAPGRKIFVGIGAPWIFDTPIPPPAAGRDLRREWTRALRAMAAARANLYVIDAGGLGGSSFISPSNGFARETGGHAFVNTNDTDRAVDQVMREAENYYVIEVADPPVGRQTELRELDVRVLRRGVTLRARRWIRGSK